jgi:hypothetical protein
MLLPFTSSTQRQLESVQYTFGPVKSSQSVRPAGQSQGVSGQQTQVMVPPHPSSCGPQVPGGMS